MNDILYSENVQILKKDIYNTRFDEIESMGLLGAYLTLSANLATYFPQFSNNEHYEIIQNIQFHRSLSNMDQHFFYLLDELEINDPNKVVESSLETGHIFVTYHTGSYRMFIQHLNKTDVPLCLVTQEQFIKEQGETVKKLFKEVSNSKNKELDILPAENPRLLFELISRLRKGISVVFYIDGNTGATDKKLSDNKNLLKIDFLNHHIYARQGIALLAYLSKAPLAIALAKRDENLTNTVDIKLVDTTKMMEDFDRGEFVNIVTKKLYGELEQFLEKNLEQWEGWFYLHKFFETEIMEENLEASINTDIYSNESITVVLDQFIHLLKYDDEHIFLVNKKEYQVMTVTSDLYELLLFFKEPKKVIVNEELSVHDQIVDWKDIEELIEMNLIKPLG